LDDNIFQTESSADCRSCFANWDFAWLNGFGDDQGDEDDDDVVDVSQLGNGDGDDAPVTSGAEPTSWDPINVDGNP